MASDTTNNTHNFSIYLMKKNGDLCEQAKIAETKTQIKPYSSSEVTVNELPLYVAHMGEYFQELFEQMMKYEVDYPYNSDKKYQTKSYQFGLNQNGTQEFIRGIIFHRVLMRKGSYFYVLQQSDRGVRFLLYTMDRIHHSSVALGFSMILPKPTEELKSMQEKLLNFTMKQVTELKINNFNELVMKDELYFL